MAHFPAMPMKTTVPADIRPQFEEALGRESEVWSCSSSRSRSGDPGETWLVATKSRLLVGDRGFGGPVSIRAIPLRDIKGCELEGGSFGAGRVVLLGKAGPLDHVCFSSLERDEFGRLGDRIREGTGAAPVSEPQVLGATTRKKKTAEPPDAIPLALAAAPAPPKPSSRPPLPPHTGRVPAGGAFDLFLDSPIAFAGTSMTGVLRLHWPKSRAVRGVRLYWTGSEKTHVRVGSGKHATTYHESCSWASFRIGLFGAPDPLGFFGSMGDAVAGNEQPTLKAGVYEYPFRFEVPKGAPAAYAGLNTDVTWALDACVDIPRAFDLTAHYQIRVIPEIPDRVGQREAKSDGSAFIRAWINPGPAGPGVKLTGGLRIGNPSGKTIRWVNVRVLRLEGAVARGHSKQNQTIETAIRFPGSAVKDSDVPFEIQLPPSYCPWRGKFSSVSYAVEVSLDVAWAFDVQVRLSIP
ncbi:MAG: hypothetical protein K8T20_16010 [Planctomycetes bacterium]|nr:hypothetical protein [Planctomycetota bacterium]